MSKLYLTESGRVIPTLCEELTTYRRARKVLHLSQIARPTSRPATLYVLARPYPGAGRPLYVKIGGHEMAIKPREPAAYQWYELSVHPAWLVGGRNEIELWTDSMAMNAWSLAIEGGHMDPDSYVCNDGGEEWRNERMGYLNAMCGEYVVRLRLEEGRDRPPPAFVPEDPASPRLASLRRLLPAGAQPGHPPLARVRVLSSWLASKWEHTGAGSASQYAPWDAETIIAWGAARAGHDGRRPIVMCVHYAVAFVSCCQASGIPARCAAVTGALNSAEGHFVAEVWFDEHAKWVVVDPNLDAIFWKDGKPMSMREIQQHRGSLAGLIEWGPGADYQRGFPHIADFIATLLETGRCFRHRAIWPRADFLSRPDLSPPAHGALTYCETDLVWERPALDQGFGMFPHFADQAYFDALPA